MSVTTTDNPITLSLRQTLGDYEVHITNDNSDSADLQLPNTSNIPSVTENPVTWPQDYHRVPNYRPLNRDLSYAERPNGSNPMEQVFLTVMFTGVALNAMAAQTWGKTGGRVFTKICRYAIGGEW